MRESDVVRKIRGEFHKRLPRAVVIKHSDQSTHGIPDLAITHAGTTTYVEVKLLNADETFSGFKRHVEPLQLAFCRRLEDQGRCFYFIANKIGQAAVVSPCLLARIRDTDFTWDILEERSKRSGSLSEVIEWLVTTC